MWNIQLYHEKDSTCNYEKGNATCGHLNWTVGPEDLNLRKDSLVALSP